jgi:hypothetical protein
MDGFGQIVLGRRPHGYTVVNINQFAVEALCENAGQK